PRALLEGSLGFWESSSSSSSCSVVEPDPRTRTRTRTSTMENALRLPRAVWLIRESVAPLLPPRPPTAHKGDAGRILLLAGSEGMAGAAALAALGAVRGGGGLVTLGCARGLLDLLATKLTEVMTFPLPETEARGLDAEALAAI